MKRIVVAVGLSVFALAAAACSSTGGDEREGGGSTIVAETEMDEWLAPRPPEEFASGLSIGFIPSGFTFVWNEGHETAVFHVFQTEDGSGQVSSNIREAPARAALWCLTPSPLPVRAAAPVAEPHSVERG